MIFIDFPYWEHLMVWVSFFLFSLVIFFLFYSFLSRFIALAITLLILASVWLYLSFQQVAIAGYALSFISLILGLIFKRKKIDQRDPWSKQ